MKKEELKKAKKKKLDKARDNVLHAVKDVKENGGNTKQVKLKTLKFLEEVFDSLK